MARRPHSEKEMTDRAWDRALEASKKGPVKQRYLAALMGVCNKVDQKFYEDKYHEQCEKEYRERVVKQRGENDKWVMVASSSITGYDIVRQSDLDVCAPREEQGTPAI